MPFSTHKTGRMHLGTHGRGSRFLALMTSAALALSLSQGLARAAADQARGAMPAGVAVLDSGPAKTARALGTQEFKSPAVRAAEVRHLRLCPRKLLLYVGEAFTLVPLPLDRNNEIVHGATLTWGTKGPDVATASSWGEISAINAGHTQVTVDGGTTEAQVDVEVRKGPRPRSTDRVRGDQDWDEEHRHDCDDPEAAQVIEPRPMLEAELRSASASLASSFIGRAQEDSVGAGGRAAAPPQFKALARPAGLPRIRSTKETIRFTAAASSLTRNGHVRGSFQIAPTLDGDGPDPPSATATAAPFNAVGSPRFGPVEYSQGSATKTKNILGSYNYVFAAPILGLPGRGLDVNLALTYNSRVWSKETSGMMFNYGKGWPAPGWMIGYGRLIDNYDGVGNWLLIHPDGTRTHLGALGNGTLGSNDGTFISFNPLNGKLRYVDGTLVKYDLVNNRWLPTSIRSRNGDLITIGYRQYQKHADQPNYFPVRWAIDQITDTLGRVIQFRYYGDAGFTADSTGAKPQFALAAVTAPDQGSGTRTLVRTEYQTIALQYNFSVPVDQTGTPASGSQITVMRRIYYPATGRGYLFLDYGTYGMARRLSVRNNMTNASGGITDGTEIAYTKYNYVTIDPNDPYGSNQVGLLNDSPQYTTRKEWWQGKIDGAAETTYTYARSTGTDPAVGSTEIDTVSYPNGMDMVVTSGSDGSFSPESFGHVVKSEIKSGQTALLTNQMGYLDSVPGGEQIGQVTTTDEAGNTARITYDYYPTYYGRVQNINEYGFSTSVQRKTSFSYSDDPGLLGQNMGQVVTAVNVYDSSNQVVAKTVNEIDNYSSNPLMDYTVPPPNHDYQNFGVTGTPRGNVTKVMMYVTPSGPTIPRAFKYDVFGNVVRADVSCCQVKNIAFLDGSGNPATFYSHAMSVTDGIPNVAPFLTNSFQYDFNTGLLGSTTDPNGQQASMIYDSAWRLLTFNSSTGATATTKFDKDANGNDQLAYLQQINYSDTSGTSKTVTSKSWFDGVGRPLRVGTGAGSTPTGFDTAAVVYDAMGRVLKQSNPYSGDSSGNGSPAFWTTNVYDIQSRVTEVDQPDDQPSGQRSRIQMSYDGATVTVTDQVGRKRRSQTDGLGRLISVTEMNPANGQLDSPSYVTSYSYDTLGNLTGVDQGGQTRSFAYDSLGRMTSQTTPEGGGVSFTYTDFGAMLRRTDARTVETHYKYDTLNRLTRLWYTGQGGSDDPNASRPGLPGGVASTSDVIIAYNTAAPGNGDINRIDDGGGVETYAYDSFGRATSKTRTIDAVNTYQTQYQYNQASQLRLMIYPSGKRLRINFDSQGRLSGEDKVDTADSALTRYVSNLAYNVAGQVTGMTSGSGVNETYTYRSDRLQLTRQRATKGGSTLMDLNYSYSASAGASGVGTTAGNSGQLMSITSTPASTINGQPRPETYSYDDLARLVSTAGYYGQRTYAYDQWGNRTSVGGGSTQTVTLQQVGGGVTNNRIASVNGASYTYDASGNLIGDGVHSYQYDAAGRLARVDSNAASYAYDSANRRLKKVVGSNTTYYIWEGGRVIAEYGNAPAGSGGTKYYLADRLSTRLVMDSHGAAIGAQDHIPFGEDAGTSTGQIEKHRFTNYERDTESGTDYAVNRQYAMGTGRFTRPDPVGGLFTAPQSFNRYAYSLNDPINLTDPSGLYEPCIHEAMTRYLSRLAGWGETMAGLFGRLAGGGGGGADSAEFAVNRPKWNYSVEQWAIHFPTEQQLAKFKSTFLRDLTPGPEQDLKRAGHTLHAIEDGHGAHKDYIGNPFGHAQVGHAPDRVIGDQTFIDVSNEVLQFLSGPSTKVRLTNEQINELINAVLEECGKEGMDVKKLKVIRPLLPQIGAPTGGAAYSGGSVPSWYYSMSSFLSWLDSIVVEDTRINVLDGGDYVDEDDDNLG